MVILYGVTHGAQEIGIFGGSRELLFLPSTRFLNSLTRFPSGTTVALEWGLEKEKINADGSLGALEESSPEELEKEIAKMKFLPKVFIKEPVFENLKDIFGKDVEVLVNY